jgi:hypothetical protein
VLCTSLGDQVRSQIRIVIWVELKHSLFRQADELLWFFQDLWYYLIPAPAMIPEVRPLVTGICPRDFVGVASQWAHEPMSPWVTDCTRISQNPKLDDPQRLMRGWRPTSWEWIFFIPSWYDDPFWHMYILLYIICVCMHVLYTDICWWFLRMISKRCVGATKQHEFSFTLRCYGQNLDQSWKSLVFFWFSMVS